MASREEQIKATEELFKKREEQLTKELEKVGRKISSAIKNGATKDYVSELNGIAKKLEEAIRKEEETKNEISELLNRQNEISNKGQDLLKTIAGTRNVSKEELGVIDNLSKTLQELAKQETELLNEQKRLNAKGSGATKEGKETVKNYIKATRDAQTKAIEEAYEKAKNVTGLKKSDLSKSIDGLKKQYKLVKDRKAIGEELLEIDKKNLELRGKITKYEEESIYNEEELRKAKEKSNQELEIRAKRLEAVKRAVGAVWNELKKGGEMWLKYNHQAMSDAKMLGITSAEKARAYNLNLMQNSKEIMRAFGMNAEQVMKLQDSYAKVTGRATILTKEQMKDVAAASQLMGEETVGNAIKIMDDMGTTTETATELMDKNYARAANAGLNTVEASKEFVKNMSLANKLTFKNGVDGISKMTILSKQLRIDLQEVANVAEKVNSIEGAITASAQLQMLGGAGAMFGGNPMQLLYEGLSDPEALYERMGKMFSQQAIFDRKKGESVIDPIQLQFIRETAKAIGMNPDTAVQSAKFQASKKDLQYYSQGLYKMIDDEAGSDIQKAKDLKATVENKATFNKERQRWEITYDDKFGVRHEGVGLNELTAEDLKEIASDRIEPVEDIKNNVRLIAQKLVPFDDKLRSLQDQFRTGEAQMVDPAMHYADEKASELNDSKLWSNITDGGWGTALSAILKSGAEGISTLLGLKTAKGGFNFLKGKFGRAGSATVEPPPVPKPQGEPGITSGSKINNVTSRTSTPTTGGGVSGYASRMGSRAADGARFAKTNLSKGWFSKGGWNSTGKILTKGGAVLSVAGGAFTAYSGWQDANANHDRKEYSRERLYARGRISEHENEQRITATQNERTVKRSEAVGEGIGLAAGGLAGIGAGAAAGAVIGSGVPVLGTAVGLLVGAGVGMIGQYLGKKAGHSVGESLTDHKKDDTIAKHLEEINEGDEEDNIKKIVLPVESIDYNVALIAEQLGVISAMPARGNVYLEAEGAGEVKVTRDSVQADHVNERDSYGYYGYQQTTSSSGVVKLNISGTIELNMNGQNGGRLSATDVKKLIDENPELQRQIASVITNRQSQNVNGGALNYENPLVRMGGASGVNHGGGGGW